MQLDLRIPMGMMFSLVGAILVAFGAATYSQPFVYARSLGINVNLWWGIVLLIFGQVMFHMGRRRQQKLEKMPPTPVDENAPRRGH